MVKCETFTPAYDLPLLLRQLSSLVQLIGDHTHICCKWAAFSHTKSSSEHYFYIWAKVAVLSPLHMGDVSSPGVLLLAW